MPAKTYEERLEYNRIYRKNKRGADKRRRLNDEQEKEICSKWINEYGNILKLATEYRVHRDTITRVLRKNSMIY